MNNIVVIDKNPLVTVQPFQHSLFDRFEAYTDVKESTLKGYTTCLNQFIRWLQNNNIVNPQRDDVKAYKEHLDKQPFTAGTRAQYLRAVKHFFTWTSAEGLYPNIADHIKGAKVKQDNTKKEAFAEADIKSILEKIDRTTEAGKRDYIMILLSVTAGLRIIEMQRANVGDLQTIKGQKVLYIQGKGHDEKDDYVKIVPELEVLFDEYFQSRPQPIKKSDPLFVGTGNRAKGKRLTEPSISRIIKGIFVKSGFDCDKLTAHSLRHTSNTLLFKAGADLFTVQRHARHVDPKTTEIYIHAVEKEKDKSAQTIYNQIFTPDKPDLAKLCYEMVQELTPSQQNEVLQFIQSLKINIQN